MERRAFLRTAVLGGGAAAFSGALWGSATGTPRVEGPSPYGPLQPPNKNGLELPKGFTSRVVAKSGEKVAKTQHVWHDAPDGGACFKDGDGWIYVSNSETDENGGVSAVKFQPDGTITDAYTTLSGTRRNCAGGATPWNTWLSCEEIPFGYVFETDPWGNRKAVRHDAMGKFMHEAAACDPVRKVIYLTEDEQGGCFYRFRPEVWGDLSKGGALEVMVGGPENEGPASWALVPEPLPKEGGVPTRHQVAGAKHFVNGEGCYYANGMCWFTTAGDHRVWMFNAAEDSFQVIYDGGLWDRPLTGVDNLTGSDFGDLYIAEDGGNMEINMITPDGVVAPVARVNGQDQSELCGPSFNPAGDRLYFSSQRGTTGELSGGITYEITGPFRR